MNNVVDSSVKTVISTGKMEDFFTMLHEYDSIRTSDCLIKNQKAWISILPETKEELETG